MPAVGVDRRPVVVLSIDLHFPSKVGVTREPLETGDDEALVVPETLGEEPRRDQLRTD